MMVRKLFGILQVITLLSITSICYFVIRNNEEITFHTEMQLSRVRALGAMENSDRFSRKAGGWNTFTSFVQRGDFWVGHNVISAEKKFVGNESITLTTPSDHTSLENLILLVERWRGPISCAVFAPGSDYAAALRTIHYLRKCTSPLIQEFVDFHLFFPRDHIPENLASLTWKATQFQPTNCTVSIAFGKKVNTYRKSHALLYPINVARNIARETARTHFVFSSDIELYPTANVIPDFLKMILDSSNTYLQSLSRKVFVLPVFELSKKVNVLPNTVAELRELFEQKLAISFHKHICKICHGIPSLSKWMAKSNRSDMHVFKIVKRMGKQRIWEPFYIGTNLDPVFHESVTWEGCSNKRIQAFTLCLLGYDFHILSNAFLVHRPGIKRRIGKNTTIIKQTNKLIRKTIVPELRSLYGQRQGCKV